MNFSLKKKSLVRLMPAAAVAGACLISNACSTTDTQPGRQGYSDPNCYSGSDSERINAAVRDAQKFGGRVRISRRKPDTVSDRDYWLLDSAILVPGNTVLIISNCRIKLSDQARDNWIRSANCVIGKPEVEWISNLHIIGEGMAVLEGADHPRSTGDSSKILRTGKFGMNVIKDGKVIRETYGTDEGKDGENQYGDWRNIGILLARVTDFSLRNLTLKNAHCWAVSLEYCRRGQVRELNFQANENPIIDGKQVKWLNQDGLDLRNGCRNITIENITGYSGDDLIALTAIGAKPRPAGQIIGSTHFCGGDPDLREQDVFNISIRNIRGHSSGGYMIVRFLNQRGVRMHNIMLDGLLDTSLTGRVCYAAVKLGDINYGGSAKAGETSKFKINNIQTRARYAFLLGAPLSDSMISNVLMFRELQNSDLIGYHGGKHEMKNVFFSNCEIIDLKPDSEKLP